MDKLDQMDPRALLLKRGTRLLAKACGGNEAAGSVVSRSGETVRRWGDPEFPDTIPLYAAMLLEAECGKPILTRLLAELSGHALKPVEGEPAGACIDTAHADMLQGVTDLTREVIAAKRDGIITPNENSVIVRAGMQAQDAIGKLLIAATPSSPPQAPAPLRAVKSGEA